MTTKRKRQRVLAEQRRLDHLAEHEEEDVCRDAGDRGHGALPGDEPADRRDDLVTEMADASPAARRHQPVRGVLDARQRTEEVEREHQYGQRAEQRAHHGAADAEQPAEHLLRHVGTGQLLELIEDAELLVEPLDELVACRAGR